MSASSDYFVCSVVAKATTIRYEYNEHPPHSTPLRCTRMWAAGEFGARGSTVAVVFLSSQISLNLTDPVCMTVVRAVSSAIVTRLATLSDSPSHNRTF